MLSLKLAVCMCVLLLVEASKSRNDTILAKTFHASYFDRINGASNVDPNVEVGGAVVLKSNLPANIQARLASALTSIYQSTADDLTRAQKFQTTLASMYSVYWSVVIKFDAVTFYYQYYILLQINGVRVLAFGIA